MIAGKAAADEADHINIDIMLVRSSVSHLAKHRWLTANVSITGRQQQWQITGKDTKSSLEDYLPQLC